MNGRRASASPPLIQLDSAFSRVTAALIVCLLCYLAARLGDALMLRPQMVWPLWPGCALLVAVLALTGRKSWPVLIAAGLFGFLLYDLPAGLSLRSSGLLNLGDTVEVLVATLGLNYHVGPVPRLDSVRSLAKYVLFAVILAPISAACAGTIAMGSSSWVLWRIYFLTEALALLTLTPAILGLVHVALTWRLRSRTYFLEAALMLAGLLTAGYITFVSFGRGRPEFLYLLVPFLLWSALRFGTVGTSCAATAFAFLSISAVMHGYNPFTERAPLDAVLSLQFFLLFAGTPFMFLAALAEEDQQAERALRESEKRFRLVANSAPVMIWTSGPDKLCTDFNQSWLDFTGRPIEAELGNGWTEGVHREDLPDCLDGYARSFDRREAFRLQYRLRRYDGEYRWVLDNGIPRFHLDGSFAGYIGSCVDVTERKLAEDRLVQAGERWQLAMNAGHIGGWEFDLKTGRNIWFGKAHELLGLTHDETSSSLEAFWDCVHSEDRVRLRAALDSAMRSHTEFNHEFRVVWRDQTVHWLRSRGSYFYRADGSPERMLGVSVDITARKQAEEALSSLNRRLIEGQEHERIRIARELHDDINQRLALLMVEMEQLKMDLARPEEEIAAQMSRLATRVSEISRDVQVISHELHSSKLEYLGVVAAMKAFCRDFAERQKLKIEFDAEAVPPGVPHEISLCLFRVLQEALHNAAKHSQVLYFRVRIRSSPGEIFLEVSDSGIGFDPEAERGDRGLGLVSMRERVRLVKGTILIQSKALRGTTVQVRVPFKPESSTELAAS